MGGGDHRHVTKTLASTTNFRAIATANQVPDQPTYFFLKGNQSRPIYGAMGGQLGDVKSNELVCCRDITKASGMRSEQVRAPEAGISTPDRL
jgi:hypothetical protein